MVYCAQRHRIWDKGERVSWTLLLPCPTATRLLNSTRRPPTSAKAEPGYTAIDGVRSQCPRGRYQPSHGAIKCIACAAGTHCPPASRQPVGLHAVLHRCNHCIHTAFIPRSLFAELDFTAMERTRLRALRVVLGLLRASVPANALASPHQGTGQARAPPRRRKPRSWPDTFPPVVQRQQRAKENACRATIVLRGLSRRRKSFAMRARQSEAVSYLRSSDGQALVNN